jgi:YVTN family beta-propeller protein
MRRALRVLALATLCASLLGCSAFERAIGRAPRVLVSNQKDGTVSVIEGNPDRQTKVIPIGITLGGLAAHANPDLVAVADMGYRRVAFIDPTTLEVVRTVGVRDAPEALAFSADGTLLFVTLPKAKAVAVIDVAQAALREPIRLKKEPKRLAVSPDGHRLYVLLHAEAGGVAVFDLTTRKLETVVPTGAFPTDFGLTRDGRRLVTADLNDDTVTVIDTAQWQSIATLRIDTGLGLVVHPTEPIAYSMASFDGKVAVLNYATGAKITEFAIGEFPTRSAITADGRYLYVVNQGSNTVVKVDTKTNQAVGTIAVGFGPVDAVVVDR